MLCVIYLSDAHIRYLFPSNVPVKTDFSSVPKFLLVFNYPDLRDIKVNDISLGSSQCCHFWFRVKILPLTTIFSMLEASFVWQGVFPYGALKLCVCVCGENIPFFLSSYSITNEESSSCSARILYSLQFSRLFFTHMLPLFLFRVSSYKSLIKGGIIFNPWIYQKCHFSRDERGFYFPCFKF